MGRNVKKDKSVKVKDKSKKRCQILEKIAYSARLLKKIQDTEIVYEDEEFIVFNDYRPAAEFHILIIPKKHYGPLQTLTSDNIPMIQEMKEIGLRLLAEKTDFDVTSELLEGFHWPIVSVQHFHLHF